MSEISPILKTAPRIKAGYARYVFWVMFSISFMNYLDRSILSGAINIIAKELHFGLEGIGFISSAFLVIYTLGIMPLGILADRIARKNVVAATLAAWSAITALTAVSTNFAMLFASRMLLGIGEAGYFPAGTALMSDYYSRAKRSRVLSWWSVAQVFGILFGTAIGGIVAGLYTGAWRLAFIFTGVPGLLLAFLAWRLREPARNQADDEATENDPSFSSTTVSEEPRYTIKISQSIANQIKALLRIKTLVVLTVMQIFAFFVVSVNLTFLPTYLQQKDTFGFKSGQAGLFSGAIIALAGMAGTILGGYLADLLTRRYAGARILVCGIGFLLSAPSFAIAVMTHNLILFTLFFVITTILLTFYQGPGTAATQDIAPSFLRATAVSTVLLIAHLLGDAFSPSIVSVLAASFDPTHGLHFKDALAGHDMRLALLVTCVPALVLAGLIGLFGARWMAADVAAAEQSNRAIREAEE